MFFQNSIDSFMQFYDNILPGKTDRSFQDIFCLSSLCSTNVEYVYISEIETFYVRKMNFILEVL